MLFVERCLPFISMGHCIIFLCACLYWQCKINAVAFASLERSHENVHSFSPIITSHHGILCMCFICSNRHSSFAPAINFHLNDEKWIGKKKKKSEMRQSESRKKHSHSYHPKCENNSECWEKMYKMK